MNSTERRSVLALATVYGSRMLGLFMVLPVFVILGRDLDGATPMLLGVALGAYGLTQAVLQIPFGMLSDRFGRKPLIYLGLVLFAAGSLVAAFSDSIHGVIAGRLLQGAGAIASVLMALARVISPAKRTARVPWPRSGFPSGWRSRCRWYSGLLSGNGTGLPGSSPDRCVFHDRRCAGGFCGSFTGIAHPSTRCAAGPGADQAGSVLIPAVETGRRHLLSSPDSYGCVSCGPCAAGRPVCGSGKSALVDFT